MVVGANTPDYRGLFLRGHGGNAANIGTIQQDAIRNIYGNINFWGFPLNDWTWGPFTLLNKANRGTDGIYNGVTGYGDAMFDASKVVPTANENRPVNTAVKYLILARD